MRGFARGLALVAAAAIALSVTALGQARFERGGRALDVAPLTVTLSPASAVNPIGTPHTVTATVTNQGNPVAGATVVFRVTGANSATGSGTTDANGIALFTYTGVQTGQDTIGAQATLVDNGTVVGEGSSDPVTKTWNTGISVSKDAAGTRTITTVYTWSISKSTSTPALSLGIGQSGVANYTLTATRTNSGMTTTDSVTGTITVANDSGIAQQVYVRDQVRTSDGQSPRGAPFTTTVTAPAHGTAAATYDISFDQPSADSGLYTNHVDALAGSSGPVLASADVSIPFTTGPGTAGTTATISDQVSCPAELACGTPTDVTSDANFTPGGSGLGTATGTTTISYKRTVTNNSLCAAQGNANQNATTSKGVVNTGTATPGDNSGQSPQNAVATVTTTAGQCLTTGSDAPTSASNNRTYKYTVTKAADQPSVTVASGVSQTLSYTVTASRVVGGTSAHVTGSLTVTNNSAAATSGLTIVDTASCPGSPGGSQTITPASQLAAGATQKYSYDVTFVPGATSATQTTDCTNSVSVSSSGNSANATIHFQLDKQGATNATGTITDTVTQCPTGLTCTPSAAITTTDTDLTQTFHPTITVRNNSFCSLSTIQNQAKFVDAQGTTVVSTTASVSVTGTCAAPGADLSITKTGPASVATNARFSWQLTVRDNGTLDATSVVVTDHLPTGISLVSATASQGTCSGSTTVTCSLGTLANGKSATVTLAVKAGSNDTVTNTASVTAKESDSNQSNNVASSTVTVGSGGTKGCRLKVAAPGFYVGIQTTIAVTATFNGAPLTGTKITLAGTSGIKGQSKSTDTKGKVSFVVHAGRPGAAVTLSTTGCQPKTVRSSAAPDCSGLTVQPKKIAVGARTPMTISLRLRGQAVAGVKVSASGAGVNASGTTNQLGRVRLLVLAKKPGIFKITAPGVLACSKRVLAGH